MTAPIASSPASASKSAPAAADAKAKSWSDSDDPVSAGMTSLGDPKVQAGALGTGLTRKDFDKFAGEAKDALTKLQSHLPPYSKAELKAKVADVEKKFNSDVQFWGNWWAQQTSSFEANLDKSRQALLSAAKEAGGS